MYLQPVEKNSLLQSWKQTTPITTLKQGNKHLFGWGGLSIFYVQWTRFIIYFICTVWLDVGTRILPNVTGMVENQCSLRNSSGRWYSIKGLNPTGHVYMCFFYLCLWVSGHVAINIISIMHACSILILTSRGVGVPPPPHTMSMAALWHNSCFWNKWRSSMVDHNHSAELKWRVLLVNGVHNYTITVTYKLRAN